VFLRKAALGAREEGMLGESLMTLDLAHLASRHNITIKGIDINGEDAAKRLGVKLSPCFRESNTLTIDEFSVVRGSRNIKRADGRGTFEVPTYTFYASHSNNASHSNKGKVAEEDGKVDGNGEKEGGVGPENNNASHYASHSPATQERPSGWREEVPQDQGVAHHHGAKCQPRQSLSSIFRQENENVSGSHNEDIAGGEKIETVTGVAGVTPIRTKTELSSLATTLADITSPLALDLEMSQFADEIWLLSIEAPGHAPWLIDIQKAGGHDALTSELKSVLENRPVVIPGFKDHSLRTYCGINIQPWFPNSAMGVYKEAREPVSEETPALKAGRLH
jgi:hypothetical protein